MESIITTLNVGNHTFVIADDTLSHNGQVYSRNIKIEGDRDAHIAAIISTHKSNFTIHETDYVDEDHVIIMLRTLLEYIQEKIPTVNQITFEDNTNIECVNGLPAPLCYFYMAFYGETWYEKHFNARQLDSIKHGAYKTKLHRMLHSKVLKTDTKFIQFLQISQPPIEIMDELECYYRNSHTFCEFFHLIPEQDRLRLVGEWTTNFTKHYLHIDNKDWIIEFPLQVEPKQHTHPSIKIRYDKTYKDFGVDPDDV
jgi:hypothetical protein